MASFLSLLKLLSLPIVVSALHQGILLLLANSNPANAVQYSLLTSEDAARTAFVIQAAVTLLLALSVAKPFFRFSARRNRSGFGTWIQGWTLIHCPFLGFSLLRADASPTSWLPFASLVFSMVAVSSLWWRLFYAERPAKSRNAT
jgi:hypothetical protein